MDLPETLDRIEEQLGRLSPVHKMLLGTDGSVTRMLEVITGQPVDVVTRIQQVVPADQETALRLEIDAGDPVNYRVVELKNRNTSEVLVYAVSYAPVDRLGREIRADFMKADIPIGKILQKHKLETRREILNAGVISADTELSRTFGIFRNEPLLSRNYQIIQGFRPLMQIKEIFPFSRFLDERTVVVNAPSRIHMGLLDMNGMLGRVDGGIGIALNDPGVLVEARPKEDVQVRCDDPEYAEILRRTAEEVLSGAGLQGGVALTMRRSPPRHAGLGSGTSASLAAARAVMELYGRELPERELAILTGRGGTSGIGTAAFGHGGFIIDGGHEFGTGKEKTTFKPSSASAGVEPPDVTVRMDFPEDWNILIAIPHLSQGASGKEETDIFGRFCPVPQEEVRELCHEVMMRLLPGITGENLELFGAAVNRIQELAFKKVELSLQPDFIQEMPALMREAGAVCAGMSSFGPALYAIGDTGMAEVKKAAEEKMEMHGGGEAFMTTACNRGAQIMNI